MPDLGASRAALLPDLAFAHYRTTSIRRVAGACVEVAQRSRATASESSELKSAAYVWLTDFVGWLPMPDGGEHEALLTADYNAEMIEHIARYPRLRDRRRGDRRRDRTRGRLPAGRGRRRGARGCVDRRASVAHGLLNPEVEAKFNRRINPRADDRARRSSDHGGMTTSDYLINAAFLLVVLRQTRERELDLRSFVVPLVIVFFVARQYVHALPTAGNDLLLVGFLGSVGLTMGVLCGFATHVRAASDGVALASVGWLAGILLAAGIGARMVFAFALSHGAEPAIRSFSISHQIGAAAWPVALVSMAVCEVVARLVIVQIRGHRLTPAPSAAAPSAGA